MCNSVKLPPRRSPRQRQLSSLSSMLLAGPSTTAATTSVAEKGSSSRTVETMLSDLSLKGSSLSSSSSEEKETNDKEDDDDAARAVSTHPARKLKSSHLIHHPQKGALLRMQRSQKRVRFAHVEIREYPITLGDNPGGASCGPPLTLEWEHQACHVWPHVQDYERARWATRRPNDSIDENDLVLTKAQRAHLLRHEFTYRDMYWASVEVKRIQLQRQQSARDHERWPAKASAKARNKLQQWKHRLVKAPHA